jgi:hypothetical protein
MSCRPSWSTFGRGGNGCAAVRSSSSKRRPRRRPPTRPTSPGEPAGKPSTGAGWRVANRPRPDPAALAERKINTTDPDTRLMKRAGGRSVQGYNAQVVASPEQVILAARITQSQRWRPARTDGGRGR